jgi:hypothetical protein
LASTDEAKVKANNFFRFGTSDHRHRSAGSPNPRCAPVSEPGVNTSTKNYLDPSFKFDDLLRVEAVLILRANLAESRSEFAREVDQGDYLLIGIDIHLPITIDV